MIQKIACNNFKALKSNSISFGKLTVLAGLNSAGKSSVIQAILLNRSLAEKCLTDSECGSEAFNDFPLNGNYMLSLGSTIEAISRESGREFSFIIQEEYKEYTNQFFTTEVLQDTVYKVSSKADSEFFRSDIATKDFYYLNSERFGPRIKHSINENGVSLNCGYSGEYTIEVLARTKKGRDILPVIAEKILGENRLPGIQDIPTYAAQWMEFITPGAKFDDAQIIGQIRSASITFNESSPPNVGFGISYVLPIVVTGLLAQPGSIMIVENPEAHLHPKGQSNIGYFLGQMAAAGIQVIVETHSEHVINGVVKASLKLKNLSPKDICISFFEGINEKKVAEITSIHLSDDGDLQPFPKNFFDQVQQDMAEIYLLKKAKHG
jgi:predicted ATPase